MIKSVVRTLRNLNIYKKINTDLYKTKSEKKKVKIIIMTGRERERNSSRKGEE